MLISSLSETYLSEYWYVYHTHTHTHTHIYIYINIYESLLSKMNTYTPVGKLDHVINQLHVRWDNEAHCPYQIYEYIAVNVKYFNYRDVYLHRGIILFIWYLCDTMYLRLPFFVHDRASPRMVVYHWNKSMIKDLALFESLQLFVICSSAVSVIEILTICHDCFVILL